MEKAGDLPFAPHVSEKAVLDGLHCPKWHHPPDGSRNLTIKKSKPSSESKATSKESREGNLMGQCLGNMHESKVS